LYLNLSNEKEERKERIEENVREKGGERAVGYFFYCKLLNAIVPKGEKRYRLDNFQEHTQ